MLSKLMSVFLSISLFSLSASLFAEGIGLNKSRIIFEASDRNQIIEINNDNNSAYLIQASILSDLEGTLTDKFIVTPPLFRIDAESKYSVRLMPSNTESLPKDRESIFYFKIRAIPPSKQRNDVEAQADLVFVTALIIKMHYRPKNLSIPEDNIFKQIKLVKNNNIWFMDNPTPYYITIVDTSFNNVPQQGSLLLPPLSKTEIETNIFNLKKVSWRVINDFGGVSEKYNFDIENKEIKANNEKIVRK